MQAAQQFGPAVPPSNADASQTPASASGSVPPEYQGLIESLKRNQSKGTLPDDVQQEMKSLKVKVEKDQAKGLHQAVKSLSKARRELREAFDARAQLHAQWRSFLSLSVTQWQTFTDQFQAQEAAAMRQIGETQAALEEAKAHWEGGNDCRCGSGFRRRKWESGEQCCQDFGWLEAPYHISLRALYSCGINPYRTASTQEGQARRSG